MVDSVILSPPNRSLNHECDPGVHVGWDQPDTPGLYVKTCTVGSVSWVNKSITSVCKIEAQPRYRSKSEPVTVTPMDDGKLALQFVRPQRAITPGQICAFYDGGTLLGGGVFESVDGE